MQLPREFYENEAKKYKTALLKVNRNLLWLSIGRVVVFLITSFLIYATYNSSQTPYFIALFGIIFFLVLVSKYTDLKYKKRKLEALIKINETELKTLSGDFSMFDPGITFLDDTHAYANDIDIFGNRSFFQYINRTVTKEGKKALADILKANDPTNIDKKQEAIKELQSNPKWQQEFRATASLIKAETSVNKLLLWLDNYTFFTPKYAKTIVIGFSIASILVGLTVFLGPLKEMFLFLWIFVGFGVLSPYVKRVGQLSQEASKVQDIFQQYYRLLMQIEETTFSSEILKEKQLSVHLNAEKVSAIIKAFSKALDALDTRNNIFFFVPANGFFLWDLWQAHRIEKWIIQYRDKIGEWFEVIAFFDAQISLANFAFNHPDYSFPKLNEETDTKLEQLGHPLVNEHKLVRNDIQIKKGEFFVITGANMAGKSTFLRTVALHHVMANTGLPVCATSSSYAPVKLITSMRTSDSLSDEESYFFSELKRLKFIIEQIREEEYFIVLDEILKGTNSKDKAEGSRKFLEKLNRSKSTGIIATHDLSLCKVAEQFPEIHNYYFDAYIENNELSFDYKFKKGVCQNMNASFLLEKMGIV